MNIRVSILEDNEPTRLMLADLVDANEGYECEGRYETAEEALQCIGDAMPDVMLVDIHLPGMTGTGFVAEAKEKYPSVRFIMCTSLEDADNIFAALKAGACGYITKGSYPDKILEAIKDAYNGGAPMSSQIAKKVIDYFYKKPEVQSKELDKLSAREQEILNLLSKGYRYKEISALLYISIETVRKHIHNIYDKLQVSSRTDAINKAYNKG